MAARDRGRLAGEGAVTGV